MARTADHNKIRELLMDGAVKAVSEFGLEGATTKVIAQCSQVNESYIYRYYIDKEDLLTKAFIRSDRNVFGVMKMNGQILHDNSLSFYDRFRKYFDICWDYMTDGFDYCKFYIRYYYSTYFNRQVSGIHRSIAMECFGDFHKYIAEGTEYYFYFHNICMTFFDMTMQTATGNLPNTDATREVIFQIILAKVEAIVNQNKIKNYYGDAAKGTEE